MGLTNYKSPLENFLFVIAIQVALILFSSCKYETLQSSSYETKVPNHSSRISGGMRISNFDPISQRALYLAIDSEIYPTALGYQAQQKDFCTTVAVHPRIILTAAHCLLGHNPKSFHVIRGVSPWLSKLDPNLWHKSETFLIHPNFKSGSPRFDVGLILLSQPLPPNYVAGFVVDKLRSAEVVLAGFGFRTGIQNSGNQIQFQTHAGELFAVKHYVQEFTEDDLLLKLQSNTPIVCAGDSGSPMLAAMPVHSIENTETFPEYALLGILAGGQKETPTTHHSATQSSLGERSTTQSSLGERSTTQSSLGERSTTQSSLGERSTIVEPACVNRALYVNLRHPLVYDWITSSIVSLNALLDTATK